jgi:hypothetical protein
VQIGVHGKIIGVLAADRAIYLVAQDVVSCRLVAAGNVGVRTRMSLLCG